MTINACEALCALLGDLQDWLEYVDPQSLDVALVAATAELVTRVALTIQAEASR